MCKRSSVAVKMRKCVVVNIRKMCPGQSFFSTRMEKRRDTPTRPFGDKFCSCKQNIDQLIWFRTNPGVVNKNRTEKRNSDPQKREKSPITRHKASAQAFIFMIPMCKYLFLRVHSPVFEKQTLFIESSLSSSH